MIDTSAVAVPADGVYLAADLERSRLSGEEVALLRQVFRWAYAHGWSTDVAEGGGRFYRAWIRDQTIVWVTEVEGCLYMAAGGVLGECTPVSIRQAVDLLVALDLLPEHLSSVYQAGRDSIAALDTNPDAHVIDIRELGWVLKHPLACRMGDLFACPVNAAAEQQLTELPDLGLGQYRCELDTQGVLLFGAPVTVP